MLQQHSGGELEHWLSIVDWLLMHPLRQTVQLARLCKYTDRQKGMVGGIPIVITNISGDKTSVWLNTVGRQIEKTKLNESVYE